MSDHPLCEVCGEEVYQVGTNYCIRCDKILCGDCIAASNREHGVAWCEDCFKEEAEEAPALENGKKGRVRA